MVDTGGWGGGSSDDVLGDACDVVGRQGRRMRWLRAEGVVPELSGEDGDERLPLGDTEHAAGFAPAHEAGDGGGLEDAGVPDGVGREQLPHPARPVLAEE